MLFGVVAIVEACIERGSPCERPFPCVAPVAAGFERDLGRISQRGRDRYPDLAAWKEGKQVRRVAVVVLRRVELGSLRFGMGIFFFKHPFEELPPASDRRGNELVTKSGDPVAEFLVGAEHVAGLDGVVEEVPDDLLAVAHAVFRRAVFW